MFNNWAFQVGTALLACLLLGCLELGTPRP